MNGRHHVIKRQPLDDARYGPCRPLLTVSATLDTQASRSCEKRDFVPVCRSAVIAESSLRQRLIVIHMWWLALQLKSHASGAIVTPIQCV